MRIERAWLIVLLVLVPASAAAQATAQTQRSLLEQSEMLLNSGQLDTARSLLARWRREQPRAGHEEQAHAFLLAARLTANADSAEDNYLNIALSHPTTRSAPEALLRLAQVRAARGDSAQASTYLERLLADYPASEHRTAGALWLARLRAGTGGNAAACATLRGVQGGSDSELNTQLKNDQARYCGGNVAVAPASTAPPKTPAPEPKPAVTSVPKPQPQPEPVVTSPAGRIAIQVGAFRDVNGARRLQQQLQRAGFDARLVRVPGNTLVRVRIGAFANRAAASPVLAKLAAADISAVLVTDVPSEEAVR